MPKPSRRQTILAIIHSSSVWMTRTTTRLAATEITPSFAAFGFLRVDSKESQPIANSGADRGRVLSDATSEHQGVQSAQRRRDCADPFLDLVANSATASAAARPVFHGRASHACRNWFRISRATRDGKLTISLNCFVLIFSVCARYQTSPGSRSPDRVLMGTPAVGVKLMLVSMDLPSCTAARLRHCRGGRG